MTSFFRDLAKKAMDSEVYIQDGKRYVNDDTKLDKSRPYQHVNKSGSRWITPPTQDTSWEEAEAAPRVQSPPPADRKSVV